MLDFTVCCTCEGKKRTFGPLYESVEEMLSQHTWDDAYDPWIGRG